LHPAIYNELKRVAQRQDVTTYGRIAPLAGSQWMANYQIGAEFGGFDV